MRDLLAEVVGLSIELLRLESEFGHLTIFRNFLVDNLVVRVLCFFADLLCLESHSAIKLRLDVCLRLVWVSLVLD